MRNSRSNHCTSPRRRTRSKQTALAVVAREIAQEAFRDACNRVLRAEAVCTPQGSTKRALDLYLTAMRSQLECLERSWARQLKS
jgi:hypothetical protein